MRRGRDTAHVREGSGEWGQLISGSGFAPILNQDTGSRNQLNLQPVFSLYFFRLIGLKDWELTMTGKQIKIRDFGEKVRYLVGTRGSPKLCDDFQGELPREFPRFKTAKAFAKRINIDNTSLNHWSNDDRSCRFRLAPNTEDAKKVARLFGIWPKSAQEDPLSFWLKNWPNWYSGEADDQYRVDGRSSVGKPDNLAAFKKAYCAALQLYAENPENSPLYFSPSKMSVPAAKPLRILVGLSGKHLRFWRSCTGSGAWSHRLSGFYPMAVSTATL